MSLEETIKDIVIKKVYTIGPKSQVKAAAALMVKKDVGSLIVLRNQRVTGVISERDVLRNIIAVGKDPRKVLVEDASSAALVSATINTSIGDAAKKMIENKVKRLVVLNENGTLAGLVTMTDLIRWLAVQEKLSDSLINYLMYQVQ